MDVLKGIANIWSFTLLLVVGATLVWFAYAVCLQKILRAKRISSARARRLLREAAERNTSTG